MRALLYAMIVALSACGRTGGALSAGGDVGPLATAPAPLADVEHFDEAAGRAAICSADRPLDFYENKEYCLADRSER